MATNPTKVPWRRSTLETQQPFRGFRGGSRGNGRGGHRGRPFATTSGNWRNEPKISEVLPPPRDYFEDLNPVPLKTLERVTADVDAEEVHIENCEYAGSYSWTDSEAPTAIVPGAPRHWLSRTAPYNVQPDVGARFIDQNAYRMPKATLVPLIAAVTTRIENNPDLEPLDWSAVDFVTDRNAFRKLLKWVGDEDKMWDFRMDLELAGEKTVLVSRWEPRSKELYNGRTYGYNFVKSSTEPAPGCQKTTGHYRIITYDLNGLKMVVRFEVDACLPPTSSRTESNDTEAVNDLSDLTAAVDLSASGTTSNTAGHSPFNLNIIKGEYEVKAPTILDITTRVEGRAAEFDWADKYPGLYFSQTPHHVFAVHNRGRFSAIHSRKQSDQQFQDLKREMQPALKNLRKLLGIIQKLVVESGQRGRLTLICQNRIMKLYERMGQESFLPDHMMALFD